MAAQEEMTDEWVRTLLRDWLQANEAAQVLQRHLPPEAIHGIEAGWAGVIAALATVHPALLKGGHAWLAAAVEWVERSTVTPSADNGAKTGAGSGEAVEQGEGVVQLMQRVAALEAQRDELLSVVRMIEALSGRALTRGFDGVEQVRDCCARDRAVGL